MMNHAQVYTSETDGRTPILRGTNNGDFVVSEETFLAHLVQLLLSAPEPVRSRLAPANQSGGGSCITIEFFNPSFPFAHRADLPTHERRFSAETLALLNRGLSDALTGRISAVPSAIFEGDDQDE